MGGGGGDRAPAGGCDDGRRRAGAPEGDEPRRERIPIAWKDATLARPDEACGRRATARERRDNASGPEAVAIGLEEPVIRSRHGAIPLPVRAVNPEPGAISRG